MKTVFIIAGIAAILFFTFLIISYYKSKNAPEIKTSKKIRQFTNKNFKQQIRTGVVIADFWASWVAASKDVLPALNEIAENEEEETIVGKVNIGENKVLVKKYRIRVIPTLIFFKDGVEVSRLAGVKPKKVIKKELAKVMAES